MNDGQETDREAGDAAYELYEKWTNGQRKSAQTKDGMCTCTTACIQRHTSRDISLCRLTAGHPFAKESAKEDK